MPLPTGSLRLIWEHTKGIRWTRTTCITALYLFINIVGRLSIAILGLTYDMNEATSIVYPVQITDWSTPHWFNTSRDSIPIHYSGTTAFTSDGFLESWGEYIPTLTCLL